MEKRGFIISTALTGGFSPHALKVQGPVAGATVSLKVFLSDKKTADFNQSVTIQVISNTNTMIAMLIVFILFNHFFLLIY